MWVYSKVWITRMCTLLSVQFRHLLLTLPKGESAASVICFHHLLLTLPKG